MDRRPCGTSRLDLSVLGLGCWQFGGGEYWGESDPAHVTRFVHQAVDLGVNYFDTAEIYNEGRSEEYLGRALTGDFARSHSHWFQGVADPHAAGGAASEL